MGIFCNRRNLKKKLSFIVANCKLNLSFDFVRFCVVSVRIPCRVYLTVNHVAYNSNRKLFTLSRNKSKTPKKDRLNPPLHQYSPDKANQKRIKIKRPPNKQQQFVNVATTINAI